MELWEILVPTIRNCGKPFRTRYHKVWDQKVYEIAGGVTILPPTKGKWVGPDGSVYDERMIPVRIACTRAQIQAIAKMTAEYYDQIAIFAYRVSDDVIIYERSQKT